MVFENRQPVFERYASLVIFGLALSSLYVISLHNFLLFHALAEVFSIIIAGGIFIVGWNSRQFLENDYLLVLGIAFLFVALLDITHTLAYKGMGIFVGYDANLPTQLWIAARYIESLSLLFALFFLRRKVLPGLVFVTYALVTGFVLLSIFYWDIFPACYIEGFGLTVFKKVNEYIISAILLGSALLLYRRRSCFEPHVFWLLLASFLVAIASELVFTVYVGVYGVFNVIGHFLKIISFFLIYRALIWIGLREPYNLLFRDLRLKQQELEESQRALATLMDNLPGVAYRCRNDPHRTMEFVSRGCSELTGYGAENLLLNRELSYADIIHPEDRQTVYDEIQASVEAGRPFRITYRILTSERDVKWVWEQGSAVTSSFRAETLEGFIADITPRVLAQQEKEKYQAQLQQVKKIKAVGQLAAGVAHDFNNLLTSILGFAGLLQMQMEPGDPGQDMLGRIVDSGQRAAVLVRQLLAFGQRQMVIPETVNLNLILLAAENSLCEIAGSDVRVDLRLAPVLWLVEIDNSQIRQIIEGLVVNARNSMPQGGILTLETRNATLVDVDVVEQPEVQPGEYVLLAVNDTGPGMDKQTQERIFEPFFVRSRSVADGTGLRMPSVYGAVKQNDGYIFVNSRQGQGTTFRIFLPRASGTQSTGGE